MQGVVDLSLIMTDNMPAHKLFQSPNILPALCNTGLHERHYPNPEVVRSNGLDPLRLHPRGAAGGPASGVANQP